jgi:hypothetical protein
MSTWTKSLLAAVISGAAGGVLNGLVACGIAPDSFNLHSGVKHTLLLAAASCGLTAIVGVAAYLKQSPLP